ncbi:hypothetical protein ACH5RR_031330 [Cinchona calisaya]|uniref:Bifunctional inhibitor/plant lipid transfer protein/seed storage helical domain-containing protein n=1 Tax=Cinchona calisaya TaxID=153742 RepID=A0ABD2YEW8_9GENT
MEGLTTSSHLNAALAVAFFLLLWPVNGQMNSTLCTSSMLRSFSSCTNFLTDGSGSSPTADCCDALKSLMSSGRDCLCLIITGGVPFRVPINRTLAASLPRACNSEGVPIECQAMGGAAPIPAPGPTNDDGPQSPSWLPDPNAPTLTPPENTPDAGGDGTLTPPGLTPPESDGFPTMTPPGVRPDLSTSQPSQRVSQLLLLALFGIILAFT